MKTMDLAGKKVAVIGMARTGVAMAHFLCRRQAAVTLIDQNPAAKLGESIAALPAGVATLFSTLAPPADAELIVLSPGVDINAGFLRAARERGTPVIGEIELACRFAGAPIAAITGTNGKSTTTTLAGELLRGGGVKVAVGGNLGTPFAALVDGPAVDRFVLEVSTFQLEGIETFRPQVAAILNITPDHINRHKTLEHYAYLKGCVARNQERGDYLVLNADDELCLRAGKDKRARIALFSMRREVEEGAWAAADDIYLRLDGLTRRVCARGDLSRVLQWQVENVLAAVCVAALAGADAGSMLPVLRGFAGLEHRLEWVRTVRGVDYVNDSKGTNVGALQKSLGSFRQPVVLIAGGQDKGTDFAPLAPLLQSRVKHLILLGEARGKIRRAVPPPVSCEEVDSLQMAVQRAMASAGSGDVVLLSPACASFDMFRDYADRGRQFKELVNRLS